MVRTCPDYAVLRDLHGNRSSEPEALIVLPQVKDQERGALGFGEVGMTALACGYCRVEDGLNLLWR